MQSSAPPRLRGGRSRTLAAFTALAALVSSAGCTVANSDAAGSTGTAGSTLRVVLAQEPPTLEPCEASLTSTGVVVRSNITEPLIERDPETGELQPLLATGWQRTDPTTWSLDLRSGVTFHDGQEFTAEDAAFSIDRAVNSDLACNVDGYVFDGKDLEVAVTGDMSLTVTTPDPDPILPLRLSFIEVVPRTTSTEDKVREPVGTGPYVLDDWETGVSISLRRNDSYWGEAPAYPEARYVWRSEPSVRAAMITKGEADLATALNPEDATDENSVAYPNNETVALRLDGREPPLDDIRVRRAMDMAVEREAIVDTLLAGLAEPAAQLVPDGVVGYNDELRGTPTDLDAARELVAEAAADGAPIDREISLIARNGQFPRVAETAEALQYQLARLGLNVRIEMLDTAAHLQYQLRPLPEDVGPVALLIMHGNQTGDAAFTASQYLLSEGAQSTFGTPELDAEIAAASALSGQERQEALARVLADQNADVAQYVHLAHMRGLMGISPGVHYEPNSASGDELRLADVRPAGREGS
ncbi:ABC transporter substrate-binding protein [Marinitenerispora sediminis]|uniref:Peptide ABC transporter substrate-binding protein n=1 Tax=Marinitenerispora sediminis TaxID=1931232 RepID=A0A368T5F0_9ACTN|nr:ABC transporter substrate-binding protein [Marinitenerispora sediminis]RCV47816.1 peptide ABC transporter substrate-binding protein [Marinitenerispora sediminis]RCV54749.1 peptide ABC transporter substrate-binding protein [Marinitenerispora sediminis]RCV58885.1 peptide ABC transporter substrate-binding protein [Marinitenerispora sediminis]